jgi:hypothetical protein
MILLLFSGACSAKQGPVPRGHCEASLPPKKTLSGKSPEESCFIAAQKKLFRCLRRHRRLLHPAKDNRTQPIFTTRVPAQMSRAKTDASAQHSEPH